MGLVGGAALLLIAGRSDRPTALGWQRRIVRWSLGLALFAFAAALVAVAHQTAVVSGRNAAALEPATILTVMLDTHAGRIWLARLGLLALVVAFVASSPRARSRQDWLAVRSELVLLGALYVVINALVDILQAVADPRIVL